MQQAFTKQSANDLVGKYVFINDGDNGFVRGKVDYVTIQDGKTKISVGDKLYDIDKLDTVSDQEYYEGAVLAKELHEMIQLLPDENNVTIQDAGLVKSAREAYEKLTETQKHFVEKADLDKLTALENRIDAFKATEFTNTVNNLPATGQIEEADAETLAKYSEQFEKAKELYEGLSDKQRKNVAEEIIKQYQAVEEAMKKASDKIKPEGEADDIADILNKILAELKGQGSSGSNNNDTNNDTDSNTDNSTDAAGN